MSDKVKIEIKNKKGNVISRSAEGEGDSTYAWKRGPGTSERINRQVKKVHELSKDHKFFKHKTKGK
jgi:hypothetical protein